MNSFRMFRTLALSCGLSAGLLSAAPLTVHNTGVDGSDVVQPIGSPTSFWTLLSEPAGASEAIGSTPFRFNAGYYADNSVSGWVSPTAGGSAGVNGFYVYQMIVDLTGFDPNTAVITGTFGTDNDGSISVNGNPPAATACFACFSSPTGFTLNSGFVAGLNSIQLAMDNGGDPSAFRVEFARATADVATSGVPEPGSFPLIVGGLSALALLRRKFRRQTEKVTA